jgi:NAD(P)-dependent dehydrogenase (short-subunit alcohol dehydrogenase family)
MATIVTLSSGVALLPTGGAAAYAASKGGVVTLSRVLAAELAPRIRVNCVCPGLVDTPMASGELQRPEVQARVAHAYALQRIAQPDEVAQAILFFTSSASSFVTGSVLAVDGGRSYH